MLQLSLPVRCRLEVTSGTIRQWRLPLVCQWNMHPDTSVSSWLGLFLPLYSSEVSRGDMLTLTLLCPTCHLTFMLDVNFPAAAIQLLQFWHQTQHMLEVRNSVNRYVVPMAHYRSNKFTFPITLGFVHACQVTLTRDEPETMKANSFSPKVVMMLRLWNITSLVINCFKKFTFSLPQEP